MYCEEEEKHGNGRRHTENKGGQAETKKILLTTDDWRLATKTAAAYTASFHLDLDCTFLPERFAVVIPKQKLVRSALDLARENRIHVIQLHFDSRNLEGVALLENQFVLRNEFR